MEHILQCINIYVLFSENSIGEYIYFLANGVVEF